MMDAYVEQQRTAVSTKWFSDGNFKYLFGAFEVSVDFLKDALEGTKSLSDVMTELQAITSLVQEVQNMTITDKTQASSLLDRMVILVDNLRPFSTPSAPYQPTPR